jgi:hypothetical protein
MSAPLMSGPKWVTTLSLADGVGAEAAEGGIQESVERCARRRGFGQDLTEHLDGSSDVASFTG